MTETKEEVVTFVEGTKKVVIRIPVEVIGYELNGVLYPSVTEANKNRPFHDGEDTEGNPAKIYEGDGPTEVVQKVGDVVREEYDVSG